MRRNRAALPLLPLALAMLIGPVIAAIDGSEHWRVDWRRPAGVPSVMLSTPASDLRAEFVGDIRETTTGLWIDTSRDTASVRLPIRNVQMQRKDRTVSIPNFRVRVRGVTSAPAGRRPQVLARFSEDGVVWSAWTEAVEAEPMNPKTLRPQRSSDPPLDFSEPNTFIASLRLECRGERRYNSGGGSRSDNPEYRRLRPPPKETVEGEPERICWIQVEVRFPYRATWMVHGVEAEYHWLRGGIHP